MNWNLKEDFGIVWDTFLHNRPFFQKKVEDHENDIDTGIANLINNYNLYKQCKDLSAQLTPISDGLNILQRDKTSIADACQVCLSLPNESAQNLVKKRYKVGCKKFWNHSVIYHIFCIQNMKVTD